MKKSFVLVALEMHGHESPIVGYGCELLRRGHAVTVVVVDEHYGHLREGEVDPELAFARVVLPTLPTLVDELLDLVAAEEDTTLVCDVRLVAGRIAHELTGVRHASVELAPTHLPTIDEVEAFNVRRAALDLAPVDDFAEWHLSPDCILDGSTSLRRAVDILERFVGVRRSSMVPAQDLNEDMKPRAVG